MNSRRYTDDEVREIRERYADGESQADLSVEYGSSRTNVHKIVNGAHYPDAPGPVAGSNRCVKLSESTACEIREKYAYGHADYRELAEAYGVSRTTIKTTVRGVVWAHAPGPVMGDDYRVPARTPGADPVWY